VRTVDDAGNIVNGTGHAYDFESGNGGTAGGGTAGADTLVGTAGADTMAGLAGNDTYVVNHSGDVVIEASAQGTDTVMSSVSYSLPNNVENLTLTGGGNINGTGNSLANVLTGNSGNNTLDGGAGDDRMAGGAGNDTYRVGNVGDVVVELNGQGTDTVLSSVSYRLSSDVENLTLTGSGNINGTGNSQANVLIGNSGNNTLNGKSGSDTLTGYGGSDSFVFNKALGPTNVDTITDFNVVRDTIALDNAIFSAITGSGTLSAAQFTANTSGMAKDSSDHIIYETDTGKLSYDSNGSASGGMTQFAQLDAGLALTYSDFFII
jgi:Ca2+-binding RTX toxin-like protein